MITEIIPKSKGSNMSAESTLENRNHVLKMVVLLTIVIVTPLLFYRFIQGQYIQGIIDIVLIMVFSLTYLLISKYSNLYDITSRTLLTAGLFTIVSAQFYDTRHIWFTPILLLAFFLRGRKEGWFWFVLIITSITAIYLLAKGNVQLSLEDFYVLLGSLTFVAVITDWYEGHKQQSIHQIQLDNEQLETHVAARTTELEKARHEAITALKARSQFLSNMSHEIRTPLNAINGFISLLKVDERDPQRQEYFDVIQHASHSLIGTINDILDYSKIESNKAVLQNEDFKFCDILESIKLFQAKALEKNITLNYDISEEIPSAFNGDQQKIKQTINNLISNAIKFTPENGSVSCHFSYNNNNRLYVSIKDNGVGIPEEKLTTIFDPFIQANGSTSRPFEGTGLGLAIAHSFVLIMGGKLEVESQEGKGSRFFFSLPLEPVEDTIDKEKEMSDILLEGHVLLVEDNKANQLFMGIMLDNLGLTHDVADDGVVSIEMVQKHDYTLILMDEHMPNMSGIEATTAILELEKSLQKKHTPIISLTANALAGDRERFLAAGMDDYISKPVDPNILVATLKKYCKEVN